MPSQPSAYTRAFTLLLNVTDTKFPLTYTYIDAFPVEMTGSWEASNQDQTIDATNDYLYMAADAFRLGPITARGLTARHFQATFSHVRPSGTIGYVGAFFDMALDREEAYRVTLYHINGQMAPTGPGGGTSYNARMPVSTGASTLWYRISVTPGSGVDNIAIKCIDNATAPTEMAWSSALPVYEHATSSLEGGRFAFGGVGAGYNGIDNLTIQPWNAGTSSFGADPIVNEDFTLDGNNYNSDSFDYDASGNLTYDGNFAFEYDAWNRLIGLAKASKVSSVVKKGSNFATYRYDGRGRRITRSITDTGVTDATYHYYYDGDRLVETRNGSDQSITQYVWGTRYVDELCQIAHNGNPQTDNDCLDSSDDHILYTLHDANYNVTAVVDKDGLMRERYEYSPYGTRQIYTCSDPSTRTADPKLLTPIWRSMRVKNTTTTLDMAWGLCDIGHQGLIHDEFEQMIYNRARTLHPQLQRFVQRDPLDNDLPGGGYQDGMNLYQYVGSDPIGSTDPSGLWKWKDDKRQGGSRATIISESGDSTDSAATFVQLEAKESGKWLKNATGAFVAPGTAIEDCKEYSVPNTVYISKGDVSKLWYKDWWSGANLYTSWTISGYKSEMESRGYKVVYDSAATVKSIQSSLGQEDAYGWFFGGHGGAGGVIFAAGDSGGMTAWEAKQSLHHKLAFVTLYVCYAGEDTGWHSLISSTGILRMTKDKVYTAFTDWDEVPVVPNP